ncbi:MAG: alpha/beta hydrolase family protein [Promethearchaeota archaeon]
MVTLKNLKIGKKKLGLFISFSFLCIGVIPLLFLTYLPELNNNYTIDPLLLEAEDGVYISAYKYTPKGEKSHAGIVVGHHFLGSKLNMHPLSIELVKRGFTVINIDFRGHGASGGYFLRSELKLDMMAAIDYLEYELPYITEIGLVGHSLGAYIALALSQNYPNRINATVAIGAVTTEFMQVSNFLLAAGRHDFGLTKRKILEILRIYTGIEEVYIGELYYGDFNDGNNIKGYISPYSGHYTEVYDYAIIYQTIQWFEQAFNGEKANDIIITAIALQIFSYIALMGIIILNCVLVVYIRNYLFKSKADSPEKIISDRNRGIRIKKLILYYTFPVELFQILFFFLLSSIVLDTIAFSSTSITLSLIIGSAIGSFLVYNFILLTTEKRYYLMDMILRIKKMCSINPLKSIIYGIIIAIISILSVAAIWHWSVQDTLPSLRDAGNMILITISSIPFYLMREFYFRSIQDRMKAIKRYQEYMVMAGIGIFIDNFLIVLMIIVGRFHLAYLPPYALYMLPWVIITMIQNCTVPWVYINSRNILSTTIFTCIIYSWMLVVFLPSYGFL